MGQFCLAPKPPPSARSTVSDFVTWSARETDQQRTEQASPVVAVPGGLIELWEHYSLGGLLDDVPISLVEA